MVEAKKGERIVDVGSVEGAKELVKEGGYEFFDEDTGEAISDPVAEVEKYSNTFTVQLGFSMDDFIKACKENGIFIAMKE